VRPHVRRDERNIDALFPPRDHLRAERTQNPAIEFDVKRPLIEQRHDVARSDHPVRRVRPANERLDPYELAGRYMHLRLELERERVLIERALELFGAETNDGHRALRLRGAR
jgi:hypothetical protein